MDELVPTTFYEKERWQETQNDKAKIEAVLKVEPMKIEAGLKESELRGRFGSGLWKWGCVTFLIGEAMLLLWAWAV